MTKPTNYYTPVFGYNMDNKILLIFILGRCLSIELLQGLPRFP